MNSNAFSVPNIVADNLLRLATGGQIKSLLYILRNSDRICSPEEIAANTGITASEAADAVMFWQQLNVIQNTAEPATPVNNIMCIQPETPSAAPIAVNTEHRKETAPRKRQHLTPTEITKMMSDSSDISELFKTAENCLGTLTHVHQNSFIWMYSYLGLKKEVIITLISYCVSIDKTNPRYMEEIACSWSDNEINTLDSAQNEVTRMKNSREYTGKIMSAFEMKRRPTTRQEEYISQWKNIGFSIELIRYAYEKTVEQIDKLSFAYINKILLSWRDSGFTSVAEVKNSENDYRKKNAVPEKQSDSFDVDKYKSLINKF